MLAPSNNFHTRIKDPSNYPQNMVLQFANGYLSANDGDIEQGGVEFEDYFCTADDLTYGECPSSSMRASLINRDMLLRSVKWGECKAFIGVETDSDTYTPTPGKNADIQYAHKEFIGKTDGYYIESTKIYDGECYSLLGVRSGNYLYVYAFGDGYTLETKYDVPNDNVIGTASIQSPRYMNEKMRTPRTVVWEKPASDGTIHCDLLFNGKSSEWTYVPMGVYEVNKPKSLSGYVVDIDEALDRMRLFDADATDFLAYMQSGYSTGADICDWVVEMCGYVSCPFDSSAITSAQTDPTAYTYTPNTSTTLRTILGYLAEAFKGVFRFDRTGRLTLVKVGTSTVETVGLDRIENSTLSTAEYVTKTPNKIINKNLGGLTYITGGGKNPYYILGNPFVQDNSHIALSDVAFYKYCPLSCVVLEADPCVDMGDAVGISMSDEEYTAFVDAYNRFFTDGDGLVYTQSNVPVKTPLMHRILRWNGVCTATYEATGNEQRLVPTEMENIDYNANIANDTDNIVSKLVVSQAFIDQLFAKNINATNFHLRGGVVDIETNVENSEIEDSISLGNTYTNSDDQKTVVRSNISSINIELEDEFYNTGNHTDNPDYYGYSRLVAEAEPMVSLGYARMSGSTITGSASIKLIAYPGDVCLSITRNNVERVYLSEDGLYFYDSNGNLTKSYPST